MSQMQFLLSNHPKWRLWRHFSFWFSWYIFQVYLYSFTPSPIFNKLGFWARIQINAGESFWYLIPNFFLSYLLVYWVIPRLVIPAKYLQTVFAVLFLIIATGLVSSFVSITIIEYFRLRYLANHSGMFPGISNTPLNIKIYLAFISGLRGSITIGGLAASIKLMKYFYHKQQQTLMLEQEKTKAELQSLKAQLHPHFLFNTLNNIYSHTQEKAPEAANMVIGLSTLLRYILYSCNAPLVPLQQETNMMLEYIELEKKRYDNQLEISIQVPDHYENLMIAPLLILPFVENCFKHGTSGMLDKPWISIDLRMSEGTLKLKCINGKARNIKTQIGGIGIENVRKRLVLLYPKRHQLSIIEEDEIYIVNLQIDLNIKAATTNEIHEVASI